MRLARTTNYLGTHAARRHRQHRATDCTSSSYWSLCLCLCLRFCLSFLSFLARLARTPSRTAPRSRPAARRTASACSSCAPAAAALTAGHHNHVSHTEPDLSHGACMRRQTLTSPGLPMPPCRVACLRAKTLIQPWLPLLAPPVGDTREERRLITYLNAGSGCSIREQTRCQPGGHDQAPAHLAKPPPLAVRRITIRRGASCAAHCSNQARRN